MVLFQSSSLVWILHPLPAKPTSVRRLSGAGFMEMFHFSLRMEGKFHEETDEFNDKNHHDLHEVKIETASVK